MSRITIPPGEREAASSRLEQVWAPELARREDDQAPAEPGTAAEGERQ